MKRVITYGTYDLLHYGHIALLRRAKALGDIVRCRETTNQQLIAFYQKLYEDIKPEPSLTQRKFALLEKFAQNLSLPGNKEGLALILQSIPSEEN